MKTSELIGPALDWAVAKCEGYRATIKPDEIVYTHSNGNWHHNGNWRPSTNWAQGGPIIEREGITVAKDGKRWIAMTQSNGVMQWGTSYLQSAMRCFVASRLGDEVDIPEELK